MSGCASFHQCRGRTRETHAIRLVGKIPPRCLFLSICFHRQPTPVPSQFRVQNEPQSTPHHLSFLGYHSSQPPARQQNSATIRCNPRGVVCGIYVMGPRSRLCCLCLCNVELQFLAASISPVYCIFSLSLPLLGWAAHSHSHPTQRYPSRERPVSLVLLGASLSLWVSLCISVRACPQRCT